MQEIRNNFAKIKIKTKIKIMIKIKQVLMENILITVVYAQGYLK